MLIVLRDPPGPGQLLQAGCQAAPCAYCEPSVHSGCLSAHQAARMPCQLRAKRMALAMGLWVLLLLLILLLFAADTVISSQLRGTPPYPHQLL